MRKPTFISALLVALLFLSMTSLAAAEEPDYSLFIDSAATAGGEVINLELRNNTGEDISVSGPVDVKVTLIGTDYSIEWPRETLDVQQGDDFLGEGDSIVISAGGNESIAVIAPGLPDTWRSHALADHEMFISAWVKIDGVDTHLAEITHTITPVSQPAYDLTLESNAPVQYVAGSPESVILYLTNDSDTPVTLQGDVVVQGTDDWSINPGSERQRFPLMGGDSLTISAGQKVAVVEIEPGTPMSWRNFYFPQTKNIKAWFQVSGTLGAGLWESESICHGIVGDVVDEMYNGLVSFTADNEDGTATITASINSTETTTGVYLEDGSYYSYNDEDDKGPVTGLKKENFFVMRQLTGGGVESIGTLIKVEEEAPGRYLLTWSHTDGNHTIFVEAQKPEFVGTSDQSYPLNTGSEGWEPNFQATISTLNRQLESILNQETGEYTGSLEYSAATLTFTANEEIDVQVNLRQTGTTAKEIPAGANPAGIFMEINLDGELPEEAEILLEVKYSRDDIPAGMNENNLRLHRYNEELSEWEILPDQEVDTEAQIIRAWLSGFSEFAVFELSDAQDPNTSDEDDSDEDDDEEELPPTGGFNLFQPALLVLAAGAVLLKKRQAK